MVKKEKNKTNYKQKSETQSDAHTQTKYATKTTAQQPQKEKDANTYNNAGKKMKKEKTKKVSYKDQQKSRTLDEFIQNANENVNKHTKAGRKRKTP